jgi:hypothetical protein
LKSTQCDQRRPRVRSRPFLSAPALRAPRGSRKMELGWDCCLAAAIGYFPEGME